MGVYESVEVGAVVLPLRALPSVAYGNPSLHGTLRILKDTFELAPYLGVTSITGPGIDPQVTRPVLTSGGGVIFLPRLISRIHTSERAKVDIGATVPVQLGGGAHDLGLNVPLEFAFNPFDYFYVGLTTGFGISDFNAPGTNSYVPLGFLTGFT